MRDTRVMWILRQDEERTLDVRFFFSDSAVRRIMIVLVMLNCTLEPLPEVQS